MLIAKSFPIGLALTTLCLSCPAAEKVVQIPGVGRFTLLGAIDKSRGFLEGPAAAPNGDLFYTDIPNQMILRLTAAGKVETFTTESRHANGLMFNARGELLACEMDGRLVAWDVEQKQRRVIAEEHQATRFNAPNDLVIDQAGGVYFTDPRFRAPHPLPQEVQGVYYVAKNGSVSRVVENLPAPNGVLLSPDEKTLYVLPSDSSSMRAYEVKAPGKLGAGREFCRLKAEGGRASRGADGATMDVRGNLYITSSEGLVVVNPQGATLGVIKVPEKPANATFAGSRLYVTARTSLYAFETDAQGHVYAQGKPGE